MRRSVAVPAFVTCAVLFAACGGTTTVTDDTTSTGEEVEELTPLVLASAEPGEGVTPVEIPCAEAAEEACNALDDDCDGVIDEGCGYDTGEIQITAAWNTGADLDLYVTDPNEEVVSFQRRLAASGGHLDHDARGECREDQRQARVENVVWSERPTPGTYRIELHYLFECDTDAGPTTATVSVAVGGRVVGVWNHSLLPNERARIVNFTLE